MAITSYGDATTAGAGGAYTDTAALSNLIKTAYDQRLSFEFSAATVLRSFADKKVVNATQPGSTVVFSIHKKMAVIKTALDEVADTNETALENPSQVTVTVKEYGNYTIYTEALLQFAFDDALASNVMNTIKTNQLETLDAIVGDVLLGVGLDGATVKNTIIGSTIHRTVSAATAAIEDVAVLSADNLRDAAAELRSDAVPTWDSAYVAIMHPRVASKFRASTDAAGWREANTYVNTTNLINGETGTFEGIRVIENPRVPVTTVEGVDVYHTFILGREALAEVVTKEPSVIVDGDIVDPYGRKTAVGWYGIIGWSLFRPESLYTVKSVLASA